MTKDKSTDPIGLKLDTLIRLQARALVNGLQTQREKLAFLDEAGLSTSEIASILSVNTSNVSKALYKIRQALKADGSGDDRDA